MSSNLSFSMSSVLDKMKSRDKDFRYMATSDLITELESDNFNIDSVSQKKLVSQVLLLLDDNSNDVQEIAAKSLGPLVKNIAEQHVLHIAQTLIGHLLDDNKKKDELRDISSIGLKTVFAELNGNDPATKNVVESLAKKLVSGIVSDDNKTPAREQHLLEVLSVMLTRFGSLVGSRDALQNALLPLLISTRQATRKRAIDCVSLLAVNESDDLFDALVKHLLENADSSKREHTRTMIQCFGAISRCVGYKLGPYLNKVIPLVAKYCDASESDTDHDLRENCLQCFETLINRCPKDITPHVDSIEELSLKYLSFDPNYVIDSDGDGEDEFGGDDGFDDAGDMDMDDGFGDDDMEAFEDDEFSDEMYSDDDDMSWKVRHACAKCISAIINTRPERIGKAYKTIAPSLLKRFSEREENVRLDVFESFRALLRQTRRLTPRGSAVSTSTTAPDAGSDGNALQNALEGVVSNLMAALATQAKASSAKTRLASLSLGRSLTACCSGDVLAPHASKFATALAKSLVANEKEGSNVRIEALILLRQLLAASEDTVYVPHLSELTPLVLSAVADNYYRVSSEGLRTCAAVIPCLAASDGDNRSELVANVYDAVMAKMSMTDVDQDIKHSAIHCAGVLLARLGDVLEEQLDDCLKLLCTRLCNEITRLSAVTAFDTIAKSPLELSLSSVLGDVTSELATLLRQANRQLRQASLVALNSIALNYGSHKSCHSKFKDVLAELTPLVSDADLHLAHLSLQLACTLVQTYPKCASTATEKLVPAILKLLSSSLLQGVALDSVRTVCKTFATDKKRAKKLITELQSLYAKDAEMGGQLTVGSASATAACVAEVAAEAGSELATPLVESLISELGSKKKTGDACRVVNLLTLGELGRRVDLHGTKSLQKTILSNFEGVEDVKQSAALALGGVTVGNLDKFFPKLLKELKSNDEKQYLLLSAARETVVRVAQSDNGQERIAPFLDDLLPLLFERASIDDEGSRNVVAECLGKLAMFSPEQLCPALAKLMDDSESAARATAVTGVKFAVTEKPHSVDEHLAPLIPKALDTLSDDNIPVRKAALLLFHYVAHSKPSLVSAHVANYLDALYGEAKIKEELIREVDLGPFKHKVDDGLELRKAAYDCMYTLLASFSRVIEMPKFIATLVEALGDAPDIRMLAHLILIRISAVSGASLLEGLDQLVEPLNTTLTSEARMGAVKQEEQANAELVRSAMRAVRAIQEIDGVESVVKFRQMVQTTLLGGEKLSALYNEVLEEEGGADTLTSSLTASQLAEF